MAFLRIILYLSLFLQIGSTAQAVECTAFFRSDKALNFIEGLKKLSPGLAKKVTDDYIDYLERTADEDWVELHNRIQSCTGNRCSIDIESDELILDGSMRLDTEGSDTILEISIRDIRVKEFSEKEDGMIAIEDGNRPHGISFVFYRVLGTISSALFLYLQENPHIARVKFVGVDVVNEALASSLRSMGFSPQPVYQRAPFISTIILATLTGVTAVTDFLPNFLLLATIPTFSYTIWKLYQDLVYDHTGKDWTLDIPLEFPESDSPD